ncbi:hypothetical protein M0802_008031 [Mischocyttarus mexicanus]|nr:hypothetical protein M0802_008031 [Mischocyttarus mexicanus]
MLIVMVMVMVMVMVILWLCSNSNSNSSSSSSNSRRSSDIREEPPSIRRFVSITSAIVPKGFRVWKMEYGDDFGYFPLRTSSRLELKMSVIELPRVPKSPPKRNVNTGIQKKINDIMWD